MIVFDSGAPDDLERIFEFNAQADPSIALDHIEVARSAVPIRDADPEMGPEQMIVALGTAARGRCCYAVSLTGISPTTRVSCTAGE